LTIEWVALLTALIFLAALLYSTVGHAGSSGYQAAMALLGVAPIVMKPVALSLNVLVAVISTIQFARAGCFSWRLFWPFAIASIPMAFLGNKFSLPDLYFRPLLGLVLLATSIRLFASSSFAADGEGRQPRLVVCLGAGGLIGLLSGLTATGGGIFLSPLLLSRNWADTKLTSGVSAAFILVNSLAGLAGLISSGQQLPSAIVVWGIAAVAGGLIGSYFGSRHLKSTILRRLMGLVLVVAGLKLIFWAG
jgi:uncharacterized protein